MKEQKLIKAPSGFARSACFIAAAFFIIYALVFTLAYHSLRTLRTLDVIDFYFGLYVYSYASIFIAAVLLFNRIKLLPIPFAIYISYFIPYLSEFIYSVTYAIIEQYEISASVIISFLVSVTNVAVSLLVILFVAFALIKKTRKITVLWFVPALVHFISFITLTAYALFDIIPEAMQGNYMIFTEYTSLKECDLLFGIGILFTGLAIRAYAKQKMHDEQAAEAEKTAFVQ